MTDQRQTPDNHQYHTTSQNQLAGSIENQSSSTPLGGSGGQAMRPSAIDTILNDRSAIKAPANLGGKKNVAVEDDDDDYEDDDYEDDDF